MERISFELEAVTPMFMGGADPENGAPEFRAPSIKGLLRFWFRAIYPGYNPDEENRLFGSTDQRSPFLIRAKVKSEPQGRGQKNDPRWDGTSIAYLGYGPLLRDKMVKKTLTQRNFFNPATVFQLDFLFRKEASSTTIEQILRAFWALCMFGGLGSRSRRGFGSARCILLSDSSQLPEGIPPFCFTDRNKFIAATNSFLNKVNKAKGCPQHTSFSSQSRLIITDVSKQANNREAGSIVLEKVGNLLWDFRSWRTTKKIRRFTDDHDNMRDFLNDSKPPDNAPRRAAFGLPHNYFFSSTFRTGSVDLMEDKDSLLSGIINEKTEEAFSLEKEKKQGRRASPLFIHIQKFADNSACGVITFLPARFLPANKKIRLSGIQNRQPYQYLYVDPPDQNFRAVGEFMDYLSKNSSFQEIKLC